MDVAHCAGPGDGDRGEVPRMRRRLVKADDPMMGLGALRVREMPNAPDQGTEIDARFRK